MKRLLLIALAVLLAAGCSTKIKTSGRADVRLAAGQDVLVAVPADGIYRSRTYDGSGPAVAVLLKAALSAKAGRVEFSGGRGDLAAALLEGEAKGCRYVIHPEISHWEPRAAAWSGRPTRVGFLVAVYDLSAGNKEILRQSLEARGRIVTLTSQNPEEIAAALFKEFAAEAF